MEPNSKVLLDVSHEPDIHINNALRNGSYNGYGEVGTVSGSSPCDDIGRFFPLLCSGGVLLPVILCERTPALGCAAGAVCLNCV